MNQPRTWLITGTSSGLGRALAEAVLAAGDQLIATARDSRTIDTLVQQAPDRTLAVDLDVTRPDQVETLIRQARSRFGRVDVLVNNAGYGLQGAIEETSDAEARHQFDVNVFGLLAVTRAILPLMRQQGSGHIINVSSQAGFAATPGLGIYAASKHAVEAITDALAAEVQPFGIRVTSIQPGPFRTEWAGHNMIRTAHRMDVYAATSGATGDMLQRISGQQPGDPAKAAQALLQLVTEGAPPQHLPLGQIAYGRIRSRLRSLSDELDAWEHLGRPTDF
jgi:NAD(P)-dependent dehydrogenase (short-subunit alcohol dehydrogenase family)